jgi:hypothetical protein
MLKLAGWIILGCVALGAVGLVGRLACAPVKVAHKALDSAEGVLDRTIAPDNVIHNYEWFHDASRAVAARAAQIAAHRSLAGEVTDPAERQRMRVEIAGMQQTCRDLAAQYNANTAKVNRDLFRGRTAPASINPAVCE